jgi:uncharacterized protein involved in exopolysaccharide biosynthesis
VEDLRTADDEIQESLGIVRRAVSSHWKSITAFAIIGAITIGALAFLLPKIYVARVLLLPAEQSNPSGSFRSLASSLAEMYLGSSVGADLADALPDVVQSRVYLQRLLALPVRISSGTTPHTLLDILEPGGAGEVRMAHAVKKMGKRIHVGLDRRTGTITLSAHLPDRFAAADAANAGATLLQELLNDLFTSQASQERRFLEGRIQDTQDRLRTAEDQLSTFRERNVRIAGSPRLLVEEGRLARAVREQEQVYLTLREQYELARIGEARRVPSLRVVDPAVPPVVHDWPPRKLFALGGLLLGAMLGASIAVQKAR